MNRVFRFSFFFFVLSLYGCKNNESGSLFLNIEHVVQSEKLEFEQKKYQTSAGHGYRVLRFKYYISKFALKSSNGAVHLLDTVQYCDAQDPSTCKFKLGPFTPGKYSELSFIFGLDEMSNTEGSLENNLANNNMEWPVPGEKGYHYMKFEGKYDSLNTGKEKNFNLHTGATGNNQNFVQINLDLPDLEIDRNEWKITLELDIDEWLHRPNDYDFEKFSQGIMANQTAQEILKLNGYDVFRIISIDKM